MTVEARCEAPGGPRRLAGAPSARSPHLTSPHLTSPHLASPHLTSLHLTSPQLTLPGRLITSCPPTRTPSTSCQAGAAVRRGQSCLRFPCLRSLRPTACTVR